jgi:class 3 adenylate cyclase
MPLFVDRHDLPGVTAEELAAAHMLDVEAQDRHGVHYHTYWFDPDSSSVFCLAEGPTSAAVEAVHIESHGLKASAILELDATVPLNEFFGSLPKFPAGTAYAAPAMRAIVFTDICDSVAHAHNHGDDAHFLMLSEHNDLVRDGLALEGGREVKHTGDGIMSAFDSVVAAVNFAIHIQRRILERNKQATNPFFVSIGMSVGEPVTDSSGDLFGAAVQQAARLCAAASASEIITTIGVKELCAGKLFDFTDRGPLNLKGLPEPTQAFVVKWQN